MEVNGTNETINSDYNHEIRNCEIDKYRLKYAKMASFNYHFCYRQK